MFREALALFTALPAFQGVYHNQYEQVTLKVFSRAATICMVYLVIHENLTLKQAYEEVVKIRPIVAPNIGFWRLVDCHLPRIPSFLFSQMIDFESQKNGGKPTVELLKGMSRKFLCFQHLLLWLFQAPFPASTCTNQRYAIVRKRPPH